MNKNIMGKPAEKLRISWTSVWSFQSAMAPVSATAQAPFILRGCLSPLVKWWWTVTTPQAEIDRKIYKVGLS